MKAEPPIVYDILGIGFGPSNLALAIAIEESMDAGPPIRACFFEKQHRFGWHRDMLIEGTTMQVSFLKDLATMRNPASAFTFLSYLHDKGRLADFINHKILFPTRLEFHDYLEWAAAQLEHLAVYGAEVIEVLPVLIDGEVSLLDVVVQHASQPARREIYRTRNIVVAPGLVPAMPPAIYRSERVWHSSEILTRITQISEPPEVVTVVGAGQSAAEITGFLHSHFKDTRIRAVFSRYGYSVADDTPFTNRIFDPGAVDDYFYANDEARKLLTMYHRNTNYSVVDADLLKDLYRTHYQEKVSGQPRLEFMNATRVLNARSSERSVELSVECLLDGDVRTLDSDFVVFASGYRTADPLHYLGSMSDKCVKDSSGQVRVNRNYRICTSADVKCGIYLQGPTEHTHGLSSTLLSNTAVRAGEILEALISQRDSKTKVDGMLIRGSDDVCT